MSSVSLAYFRRITIQDFLALPVGDQSELIRQEIQKRGVMEDLTTDMNFYLLVLSCLAATGGVVYGTIKFWAFMKSTCRLAFKPRKATEEDVEMFNGPFRDDPALGRAFDAEVKKKTKSSQVPQPVKQAAKNLQSARSRDSSPAGSSRSQGSGGAGPSETPWRK